MMKFYTVIDIKAARYGKKNNHIAIITAHITIGKLFTIRVNDNFCITIFIVTERTDKCWGHVFSNIWRTILIGQGLSAAIQSLVYNSVWSHIYPSFGHT